jgi:tellurite methyltransferase
MTDTAGKWNERYGESDTEWFAGKEPSILGRLTVSSWNQAKGDGPVRVIDLGCGEGRDAVHFARQGWAVSAVDVASNGVRKTQILAAEAGVALESIWCGDLRDTDISAGYDILFAHNSLSGLADDCLPTLARIRAATPIGGMNAIRVFTNVAPRTSDGMYFFEANELKFEYRDWRVLYYGEDLLFHPPSQGHRSFADIIALRI